MKHGCTFAVIAAVMVGGWGCTPAGGESEDPEDGAVRDVQPMLGRLDAAPPIPEETPDAGAPGDDRGVEGDGGPVEDAAPDVADLSDGDPDCAILAACLMACDDGECSGRCRDSAPAESGELYDAIYDCGRANGCNEPGGGFDDDCIAERCADERFACYGDGELPPPPPPTEDLDCAEVRMCVAGCGAGDVICTDACEAAATAQGAADYDALQRCRLTSGCPPADVLCFEDACADEIATCDGRALDPDGDPDCEALAACINDCEGDQACVEACGAAAPPAAVEIYNAAVACLQDAANQCPPDDQECANALCEREVQACVGQPVAPTGEGTCDAFDECLGMCGGEQACVDACITATSQQGYDQYVALVDCFNMSCPAGSGASCGVVNCEPEFEACLGPVPVPRGVQSCAQFNDCLSFCVEGDQVCVDRCIELASPAAYDALVAATNCIADAGCAAGDAACQNANCGNEINACLQQ